MIVHWSQVLSVVIGPGGVTALSGPPLLVRLVQTVVSSRSAIFSADRRSGSGGLVNPASRAAVSNFSCRRHAVDVATGGFDSRAMVSHVRFGFVSLRTAVSFTFFARFDRDSTGIRPGDQGHEVVDVGIGVGLCFFGVAGGWGLRSGVLGVEDLVQVVHRFIHEKRFRIVCNSVVNAGLRIRRCGVYV
ncbi:hypothetical protein GA0061093_13531 [Rhodococcus qingshengii]|nr:hypothetical protein GA0061093_13531 [Rhodococcus qingshengii]